MNKKSAIIVMVILVCSLAAGAFMILNNYQPTTHDESPAIGEVVIQEVYPFSSGEGEFIELQFRENMTHLFERWKITDYDREPYDLPMLTGWSYLALITIYTGSGSSDLNATDGRAIIYLNQTNEILDDQGDEIALLDNSSRIVDFVRYRGGNSDIVEMDWLDSDEGPTISHIYQSAQLFGLNTHSSVNWVVANKTPTMLNALPYTTQDGIDVVLVNGIDDILTGDIVQAAGPQVVRRYPGVNVSICREIHEMVDFTMHLLFGEGYHGPAVASDGRLYVDVAMSDVNESTGYASSEGRIRIWIGAKADKVELKAAVEHEVAHMFQFAYRERSDSDLQRHYGYPSDDNNWWNEGFADYWGIESAKRNYNKTTEEVHAARRATGSSNWWDHGRDTNTTVFHNWSLKEDWDRYQIAYQFMKFLVEEYGSVNVSAIYHAIWYDGPNSADNVEARTALEQELEKTMDEILTEFYLWKILDREDGDIPYSKIHYNITLSDDNATRSIEESAYPGGALVQRIIVNSTYPIHIRFGNVENWSVAIFLNNTDGTVTNFTTSADEEIVIDPEGVEEITIIKVRGMDSENRTISFTAELQRSSSDTAADIQDNSTVSGELPFGTQEGGHWFRLNMTIEQILNITMYAEGTSPDFNVSVYQEGNFSVPKISFKGYGVGEFPRTLEYQALETDFYYIHIIPNGSSGFYTMDVSFYF